jgi:uncharacterized FlaG/YvyC family protein
MEISSTKPADLSLLPIPTASPQEAAQRRELLQATKSVNASGRLGQNQLVFTVDRATHRPIIRVEDRDTHEVVFQVPPEYVLRLAHDLGSGSSHTSEPLADT